MLVAISIPIFTGQLQKARFGTNQANARSALSAASADWLATDDTTKSGWYSTNGTIVYYKYNCSTGNLDGTPTATAPTVATQVTVTAADKTASGANSISDWTLTNLKALGTATYKTWYIGINSDGQCAYIGYVTK